MKQTKLYFLLAVIVCFSQCKQAGYMSRKYTKGKYHESKDKLTAKTNQGNTIKLNHPGAVEAKKAIIELQPQKITLSETNKKKENVMALGQPENKVKKHSELISPENKQYLQLMRANLRDGILKAFTFKKDKNIKSKSVPEGVTTGLSIGAFASGVGSIILAFAAIIFTFITGYISPYFFVAMGLGIVGIALGITTLVMGQGDLGGMQKTFSTLGIALGGGGLIIAILWYLICLAIISYI